MKDSGIPWVGKIPEDWCVEPLRQFFTERKHKNANGTEDNLLSLSYGRIIRKDIDSSDGLLPANFLGYNIVESGDIVFRMTDLQNDKKSLRSGLVGERGIITSAYVTVAPKRGVESRFHSYLQRAYDQLKVYYNMGSGVRQGINYGDLKRMPVLAPPFDEQQRIADYLDARCGEIDEVKQTLFDEIEALQRLRKATIHKAVTKGLDESVPMKDSGVEWIGEIPEEWDSVRLKSLYDSSKGDAVRVGPFGSALASSDFVPEGVWVYTQRTVLDENFVSNDTFVSPEKAKSMLSFGVYPGDLLITTRGTLGHIAIVPNNAPYGVLHPCLIRFRINRDEIMPAFLKRIFNECDLISTQLKFLSNATTIDALYSYLLKELVIPLPSLDEQQQIADYLDRRCAVIDSIIDTRTKQLERLEDYRKALVFAYVTGKKEVPVA